MKKPKKSRSVSHLNKLRELETEKTRIAVEALARVKNFEAHIKNFEALIARVLIVFGHTWTDADQSTTLRLCRESLTGRLVEIPPLKEWKKEK